MANQKISELTQTTTLSDSDLIPIAHKKDANSYETLSTSLSDLKNNIVGAAGAISKIVYSDGNAAIYTSGDTLYLYDDKDHKVAYLSPLPAPTAAQIATDPDSDYIPLSKLVVGTSTDTEGIIKLSNRSTVAATTTVAAKTFATKFNLSELGFRVSREEYTGSTNTGAWQLRMNSLDTYLYSKNHVEITAGSKIIKSDLSLSDLLTSAQADRNVRINLLSGGDIFNTARDAVYFTTPVFQVKNANEDAVFTITATDTKLVDASGDNILSQHYDSTNTANNTIKLSRGGVNDVLYQDKNNTYLYDSDGDNILTAYYDGSDTSNSTVTFQTDTFQVKNKAGNVLLFDDTTITNLVATVANKENATVYAKRYAIGGHATYQYDSTRDGVIIPVYNADGTTLKEMSSFTGKVSFWFSAIKDANSLEITTSKGNGYSNTYILKDVQYSSVYLKYLYNGAETYVPLYIYNSIGNNKSAYVKDLYGKTIECSVSKDFTGAAGVINGSIEAEIMPTNNITLNTTTPTYAISAKTADTVRLIAQTTGCSVTLPTTLTTDKSVTVVISTSSSAVTINGIAYQPGDVVFCIFDSSTTVWNVNKAQYNVLHTTGDETAAGVKTFTSGIKTNTIQDVNGKNLLLVEDTTSNSSIVFSRPGETDLLYQEKNYTRLNESAGEVIVEAYYDGSNNKNNRLNLCRGGANTVLSQEKGLTSLYNSDGTEFVTYAIDETNNVHDYNVILGDSQILSMHKDLTTFANNTFFISRGNGSFILRQTKNYTTLSDSNGGIVMEVYTDGLNEANNTLTITRGSSRFVSNNVLSQTSTDTILFDSNSKAILSHTVGAGVTYSADSVNYFKLYNNVIAVSQPVLSTSTIAATGLATTIQTLTDATTIAWNASIGGNALLTLTDTVTARTISNITNPVAGSTYKIIITQSATATYPAVSWDTLFKFPGSVTPVLNATASGVTLLEFLYTGTYLRLTNLIAY